MNWDLSPVWNRIWVQNLLQFLKNPLGDKTWSLSLLLYPQPQLHQITLVFCCKIQIPPRQTDSLSIPDRPRQRTIYIKERELGLSGAGGIMQRFPITSRFFLPLPCFPCLSGDLGHGFLLIAILYLCLCADGDLQSKARSCWNYNS